MVAQAAVVRARSCTPSAQQLTHACMLAWPRMGAFPVLLGCRKHSFAGGAAGGVAVVLLHPFDVIKTRLQGRGGACLRAPCTD